MGNDRRIGIAARHGQNARVLRIDRNELHILLGNANLRQGFEHGNIDQNRAVSDGDAFAAQVFKAADLACIATRNDGSAKRAVETHQRLVAAFQLRQTGRMGRCDDEVKIRLTYARNKSAYIRRRVQVKAAVIAVAPFDRNRFASGCRLIQRCFDDQCAFARGVSAKMAGVLREPDVLTVFTGAAFARETNFCLPRRSGIIAPANAAAPPL